MERHRHGAHIRGNTTQSQEEITYTLMYILEDFDDISIFRILHGLASDKPICDCKDHNIRINCPSVQLQMTDTARRLDDINLKEE